MLWAMAVDLLSSWSGEDIMGAHTGTPTLSPHISKPGQVLSSQFPLPPRALCLEGPCHLEGAWLRELQDCCLLYLIPPIRG